MAITNAPLEFDGLEAITTIGGNARTTGDPIPYVYPQTGDTITTIPWTTTDLGATWTTTPTLIVTPDTKEAITILEEAEYELKELLKKTPAMVNVGPKGPQDYIEIALRSTQAALRALLKIGG